MSDGLHEAWDSAISRQSQAPASAGGHYVFRTDKASRIGTFAGVDPEGSLLFAVETTQTPPYLDLRSDAIDYFRQERAELGSWLLFLRLKRRELRDVFARLCHDLIHSLTYASNDQEVTTAVVSRIRLWQQLFELRPGGILAPHEIKGLTAELLYILRHLESGSREAEEIVNAWLGPSGCDQDFVFSAESVEVKAVGPSSELVSISSLQQLQSDRPLSLSIWTLRQAAPTESAACTLNGLVLRIERFLHAAPSALAAFRERLLSAGYVHSSTYDTIAFEPIDEETFSVSGDFPRITETDVPPGVGNATYTLSLHWIRQLQRSTHG
ncbi:PD-(D/E)XK motif protein [Stenotrophomonas sp. TWI819]|uniref:PD-(D/E)XK motif protein n=1 Tax=Stenotrophomonas sp. TWI819 TaxID=3136800 RepID=UPI003208298F